MASTLDRTDIEKQLKELTRVGLAAQWERVKNEWEPQVSAVLTSAAKASHDALVSELTKHLVQPWQRRDFGGLKLRLAHAFQEIASQRAETAKMLLVEMVRQESMEASEILTIGGIAAQPPRIADTDPDPNCRHRRVAALPVLERAMAAGLLAFTREVVEVLGQNERQNLDQAELDQRLEKASRRWRNRLAATSATLVMAVAGRARSAVRAALR